MAQQEDGGSLKRTESFQWPSGHVGHLSEGQSEALARFKELCARKGYYTSGDEKTPASHDDETLLRYLRARKFVPQEAFGQLKGTEDWRKENQLDKLYETIDVEEYDTSRRLYPQWTGRRDKRGIPFYVFEIGNLDPKEVSAYSSSKDKRNQSTNTKLPWKMLKLFALYENLCRFVLPMCSAIPGRSHSETPVSQSNNIVDISGVGFAKFWSLRNHMSDASTLATAHYPETLDRIFVVGAPSYFPTIWQWAQKWFDPITVSKIFILTKSNMTSTLEKFVDIENIPRKYGGKLDWEFGNMPYLDPDIVRSMQWTEKPEADGYRTFPIGPIKWEYAEDGDLVATAIGTENGQRRHKEIARLTPERGVARLALTPGRADGSSTFNATSTTVTTKENKTLASNADEEKRAMGTDDAPVPSIGRQGTSATKFEQQSHTHAAGQVADGTPEVKVDGQGEKQGIMDPNTVGQAPKEHPMKFGSPEEPPPSVLEQAQTMVSEAVEQAKTLPGTVMGIVSVSSKEEAESTPAGKKEDPEIDGMENKHVEEYLRSETMTKPASES